MLGLRATIGLLLAVSALLAAWLAVGCGPAFSAARRVEPPPDFNPTRGVLQRPVAEPLLFADVAVWRGQRLGLAPGRFVRIDDGRIVSIGDAPPPGFAGRVIEGRGKTLIPGLIDTHLHLLYGSGPDLFRNRRGLIPEWLEKTGHGSRVPEEVFVRGQLRLMAGVTTVRILGDGMYSLRYRDEVAAGRRVGPRVLTAGLHVNGPAGYVTAGVAAALPRRDQPHAAVELETFAEIASKVTVLLDAGVDVIKLATTHGDLGFSDARPDLPEDWVREVVRVAHQRGVRVVAHSYGAVGDWAAVRGGVDGIEHLVNVPGELDDDLVRAIRERGLVVCPTLSGSSYGIHKLMTRPGWLADDPGVIAHVDPAVRKEILQTLGVIRLPGFTRFALGQPEALEKWERWYAQSLANTRKLHRGGVKLVFGTDAPFVMGNFFHSVGNEIEALRAAGLEDAEILEMATAGAADAIGLGAVTGRIEEGFAADLVLLPTSPTEDLQAALDHLELVVARGRVVFSRPPRATLAAGAAGGLAPPP